ncbi:FAD:protein FMN transferase [Paenibacillus sp. VCA1]|uniref:FAD:protein FMN transferase n=1 Tax=Paenibacillus sp. VCA1 TaxID=3039148 RepID=UPI0028712273|nr:FAD:protein FMN transferase [Paenibacillus sp. VCA1]MDR9855943.1 FAD:protein FMN transferase [Paenibacillus sp. VCA1]
MQHYAGRFMNTDFSVTVTDGAASGWKEQMQRWFAYVDQEWSRFREDNELNRLNQAPEGVEIGLPPPLYDVLKMAEGYRKLTEGRFSPFLKRAMEHQGYNRPFPFSHVADAPPFTFQLEEHPIRFYEGNLVEKHTSEQLDLGGIAKGYAVQSAAEWLKRHGAACGMVDGGGDMTLWSDGSKEWNIGIADPWNEAGTVEVLSMKNKAVATSSRLYRSWMQGGQKKHHLLDGRTGQVIESGIVQSTVMARDCVEAEVCAKMCFLLGSGEREVWFAERFPDVYYVLVMEDGTVVRNRSKESAS